MIIAGTRRIPKVTFKSRLHAGFSTDLWLDNNLPPSHRDRILCTFTRVGILPDDMVGTKASVAASGVLLTSLTARSFEIINNNLQMSDYYYVYYVCMIL